MADVVSAVVADTIERIPVASTFLRSYGYDPATLTLAVELTSGDIYYLADVKAQKWSAFVEAPSKGKFYGMALRGKHVATKMTGECPACGDKGWLGVTCADCGCDSYQRKPRPEDAEAR